MIKKLVVPLILFIVGITFWGIESQKGDEGEDAVVLNESSAVQELNKQSALAVVTGDWRSDFGKIVIRYDRKKDELQAVCLNDQTNAIDGWIKASLNSYKLSGFWVQEVSQKRCASMKLGSYYWGRLQFDYDFLDSFVGKWSYCADPLSKTWNGRKIIPQGFEGVLS